MGSPTIQNQRIQRAWTSPSHHSHKNGYLKDVLQIHVHIYVIRTKRVFLGYYHPEQVTMDMSELMGMKVKEAVQLLDSKKSKYHQMMKLLDGNLTNE